MPLSVTSFVNVQRMGAYLIASCRHVTLVSTLPWKVCDAPCTTSSTSTVTTTWKWPISLTTSKLWMSIVRSFVMVSGCRGFRFKEFENCKIQTIVNVGFECTSTWSITVCHLWKTANQL